MSRPSTLGASRYLTTIEPAAPAAAFELSTLHRNVCDRGWSAAELAALLDRPASLSFLARGQDGLLAGFVISQCVADEAEVLSIAVAPDRQRSGIGRRLLSALIDEAATRGAERLFLEVAEDNVPALALYRVLGFSEAGRRRSYYVREAAPAVDALILARRLRSLGGQIVGA